MDYLIKKNIVKKNKIIVDVGNQKTRLLGVHYAGGKINVTGSYTLDTGERFDARNLVAEVSDAIFHHAPDIKNGDIVLSVPSKLVQFRLESVKNMKLAELDKYIRVNHQLNKAEEQTHIIDWTYLGEREENADTVRYYLVAAINKSAVYSIIEEFQKQRLNITEITFAENNMVCLSDLWHDDYEYMNKLYIDFGAENSRIIVESGGVIIYSRLIDFGLRTGISELRNEIIRIIRMYGNDGMDISKIICLNKVPGGLFDDFAESGITVEIVDCKMWYELDGDGYLLSLINRDIETEYALTVGAGLSAMQSNRRLNLMPADHKEKQAGKFLAYAVGGVVAVFALIMVFTYINLGLANFTLNKLSDENTEYSRKEARITELETADKNNKDFIAQYKDSNFPFYKFLKFLEENKPHGLTLLSVDSLDRLTQMTEAPESEETIEEPEVRADEIKDLAGEKVSIRGYSTDSQDISILLYNLSKLPYITKLELKAIEENTMGGERINLFEAILTLGGAV